MLRRNVNFIHYLNKKYPFSAVRVTYRFQSKKAGKDDPKVECPPDGSGRGFYFVVGSVIIGAGGLVMYAKSDPDFRQWLKENVPPADKFVALVTAENKTYSESLSDAAYGIKNSLVSRFGELSLPAFEPPKEEPCDTPAEATPPPETKTKSEKPKEIEKAEKEARKELEEKAKAAIGSFDVTGVHFVLETILKQIRSLRDGLKNNYKEILCVYRDLSDFYSKIVDGSVQNADASVMDKIKELRTSKNEAAKAVEEKIKSLLESVDDQKIEMQAQERIIRKSTLISEEQKEDIDKIRTEINGLFKDVEDMKRNFERERAKLSLTERYWKQVQEARKHFSDELELLFPNVKIQDKNMKLADEELDLFILYAFQNILFYQKELAKLDAMYKANLDKAFSNNVQDKDVIRAVIENEAEQERRKICADFQKRMLVVRAECERDMRQSMMRQAEAHVVHVKELTELKERQGELQLQRAIDEKMAELRLDHQAQLADIIGRMRALDTIINKKLEADAKSNKSQELWAACQALQEILTSSDASEGLFQQFKPLNGYFEAVKAAACSGDDLVETVLNSLPTEAKRRGVFNSIMLKDRFLNVKRVCKKVALLPEGGAPLPVMFLSWIQAKLIIDCNDIPADELNNKEFDPTKLNTFQILDRANYWIERNDYKQALKYMNLLKGAPRAVAGDWIRETQIFLEVSQAARALMAYAAASSSMYK